MSLLGFDAAGKLALGQLSPATPLTEGSWHYAWSEPVQFPARLSTPNQVAFFWSESAQFPETVTESRWHQPWSEPVRVPPRLITGAQRDFFFDPQPPIINFAWFTPLNDPVKVKAPLPVAAHQFISWTTYNPWFPGWFSALAEPVRVKVSLGIHHQKADFFVKNPPVLTDRQTLALFDGSGSVSSVWLDGYAVHKFPPQNPIIPPIPPPPPVFPLEFNPPLGMPLRILGSV